MPWAVGAKPGGPGKFRSRPHMCTSRVPPCACKCVPLRYLLAGPGNRSCWAWLASLLLVVHVCTCVCVCIHVYVSACAHMGLGGVGSKVLPAQPQAAGTGQGPPGAGEAPQQVQLQSWPPPRARGNPGGEQAQAAPLAPCPPPSPLVRLLCQAIFGTGYPHSPSPERGHGAASQPCSTPLASVSPAAAPWGWGCSSAWEQAPPSSRLPPPRGPAGQE